MYSNLEQYQESRFKHAYDCMKTDKPNLRY